MGQLEYDNSAFYYFMLSLLSLYLVRCSAPFSPSEPQEPASPFWQAGPVPQFCAKPLPPAAAVAALLECSHPPPSSPALSSCCTHRAQVPGWYYSAKYILSAFVGGGQTSRSELEKKKEARLQVLSNSSALRVGRGTEGWGVGRSLRLVG